MNNVRVSSFPDLSSTMGDVPNSSEDPVNMEEITTNVKLLLKLLNDHNEASEKGCDPRQGQRLVGMITILDDVKVKIQKFQISCKKRPVELRRCNTDLRGSRPSGKSSSNVPILDEKERIRRDLSMSFAAQKRLGVMCSSLGKEKQIIARELSRKVQEIRGIEELLSDYKEQNEKLVKKVEVCRFEHSDNDDSIKLKLEETKNEVTIGKRLLVGLKQKMVGRTSQCKELEELGKVFDNITTKLSN